eukprot:gene2426-biopygen32009
MSAEEKMKVLEQKREKALADGDRDAWYKIDDAIFSLKAAPAEDGGGGAAPVEFHITRPAGGSFGFSIAPGQTTTTDVAPGGAAEASGVKAGMRIVAINERAVSDSDDVIRALLDVGDTITIFVDPPGVVPARAAATGAAASLNRRSRLLAPGNGERAALVPSGGGGCHVCGRGCGAAAASPTPKALLAQDLDTVFAKYPAFSCKMSKLSQVAQQWIRADWKPTAPQSLVKILQKAIDEGAFADAPGHALMEHDAPIDGPRCGRCQVGTTKGAKIHMCLPCQYLVCHTCWGRGGGAAATLQFKVGDRVRARDHSGFYQGWKTGTVTQVVGGLQVRRDGEGKASSWDQIEPAASDGDSDAATASPFNWKVGDRVRARDELGYTDDTTWKTGTVTQVVGGLKVKRDGAALASCWDHVEPIASDDGVASSSFAVDDRVRVRNSHGDVWLEGIVTGHRDLEPLVRLDGDLLGSRWQYIEKSIGRGWWCCRGRVRGGGAATMSPFKVGDKVRYRDDGGKWRHGVVAEVEDGRPKMRAYQGGMSFEWGEVEHLPDTEGGAAAADAGPPPRLPPSVQQRGCVSDSGYTPPPAGS